MTPKTTRDIVSAVIERGKQRPETVLRPITSDHEMGLLPVAWSWEQWGGMCNAFPHNPGWESRSERNDDANQYWIDRGFVAPRPLFLQTPLQAAAPEMLIQLKALIHISNATNWEDHTCGEIARARALVERIEEFIALQSIKEPSQ